MKESDVPDPNDSDANTSHRTHASQRDRRIVAWFVVGGIALALGLIAVKDPAAGGYPPCAIRNWTGLECATCGGLRATHEVLHGRLGSALGLNPLAVISLPLLALLFVSELRVGLGRSALRTGIRRGHWMWVVLAAMLVYMVMRNIF